MARRPRELDDPDRQGIFGLHLDFLLPDGTWVEVPMRSGADLVILRVEMLNKEQHIPCGEAGWKTFRLRYDFPLE